MGTIAQGASFCFRPHRPTPIHPPTHPQVWSRDTYLCLFPPNWKKNLFGLSYIIVFQLSCYKPSADLFNYSWRTVKYFSYSHTTGCFLILIHILKRPLLHYLKRKSMISFKYVYLASMEVRITGLLFSGTYWLKHSHFDYLVS